MTHRFVWAALIAAGLACGPHGAVAAATGKIVDQTVRGESLENNVAGISADRSVLIYLPPSYEGSDRRYPVLYVLHGIFDSHRTWTRTWSPEYEGYGTLQDLMDRGIANGRLREMILVVPDAEKTCHYTDSPIKGGWDSFIAKDLVGFVDRSFRTVPEAASRGIMGHSMGGHGAIKIAMKNPGTFGAVYAMNPSLLGWGPDVSADNEAYTALARLRGPGDLDQAGFQVQAIVGVGQCFSPNPKAPFLTDFPFESEGTTLRPSEPGFTRWQSQMPLHMISDHLDALRTLRGLRFDSAFEDEFAHIPITAQAFSRALAEAGVDHLFEMYNGDHRNRLWGRDGRINLEVLPWFSLMFEAPAPVAASTAPDPVPHPRRPSGKKPDARVQVRFWEAARQGDIAAAREALDRGADVNALDTRENENGRRALNYAAWSNHAEMIRWLVDQGADPGLANRTGFTPLHHAAEAGSLAVARVLLERGADRTMRNRFGHTPADTARRHGHAELVALLEGASEEPR